MPETVRQSTARGPSRSRPLAAPPPDLAVRLLPLQASLRRKLRQGPVLAQMIRAVNSSLDPERVGQEIVSQIAEWLPLGRWMVVAMDDGARFRTFGATGSTADAEDSAQAVGRCILRGQPAFGSANLASDTRVSAPGLLPPVAALAFPLECRGRTFGAVVGLDGRAALQPPELAPATLQAFVAALEPGAIALDNALRVQRAEALSLTDDLTQLYNSRYLSLMLRRETKRADRCGRPLSLLFVDLDGFKSVNDAHGHLAGSRALVEAAVLLKSCARETDVVARFGGDEFCIVLPDTGSEGARAVADRVRERIEAHRFLGSEGAPVALTGSVGVATFPDAARSSDALIHASDEAMYWVKARGKNGIHVAA